jgi:MSHA pilin protein MshD
MLRQAGFTLIEIVISIVIVSIALSVLVLLTSKSTERSVDPLLQEQAISIAQAYLEEIMQKQFCDPDWDHDSNPATTTDCPLHCVSSACSACKGMGSGWTTESRASYDDICDYVGTDNPPLNQLGVVIPGLANYSVNIAIDDTATADLNGLTGNSGQVARIDVTVSNPSMRTNIQISGFRANF